MSTSVLIPWKTTRCEHRHRALAYVLSRLAEHGWPVVIGRYDSEPWCKARAIADALEQTDADVLVLHDADVWTNGLPEAVQQAQEGTAWAVPHRSIHRLSEVATALYVAGVSLGDPELEERAYLGIEGGGITVVRRDVYEACPIDPRFVGWSGEDEAFGWALRATHGPPWRPLGHAPLWHLWHPAQARATRARGSLASWDLRKRYARARHDPVAMRALLGEVVADVAC